MDPNLFHLDFEKLFEVLVTIVVFSFLLERALSVFFEMRIFIEKTKDKQGIKEIISLTLAVALHFASISNSMQLLF